MKNRILYTFIAIPLLISLFIYLIFRDSGTVVNVAMANIFPHDFLMSVYDIRYQWHLPNFVIYNLPEGLWVFSITLVSKNTFIKIKGYDFHMVFLPLLFATGLEFAQLLHITDGIFDRLDIAFSLLFWLIALSINSGFKTVVSTSLLDKRPLAVLGMYCIVYLSDIFKPW